MESSELRALFRSWMRAAIAAREEVAGEVVILSIQYYQNTFAGFNINNEIVRQSLESCWGVLLYTNPVRRR